MHIVCPLLPNHGSQDGPPQRLVTAQLHPSAPPFFNFNPPTRHMLPPPSSVPSPPRALPSAVKLGSVTLAPVARDSSSVTTEATPKVSGGVAVATASLSSSLGSRTGGSLVIQAAGGLGS